MEAEKLSNVSFGTGQNRRMFPMYAPQTRFGNEMVTIRGSTNTGPGCYNNEDVNNFESLITNNLVSTKGYMLGARTAKRFDRQLVSEAPCPTTYQSKSNVPIEFTPAYRPFQIASERFPSRKADTEHAIPGPGTYDPECTRHRSVQYHQSFGAEPINIPSVHQHSTIDNNTNKLLSTKEEKKYQRRLAYLQLYY